MVSRDEYNAYHREYQRRQRREAGIPERQPAECGSTSGYLRHKRLKEAVCGACREAWNAYQRELYRRRKQGVDAPKPPPA